MIKFFKKGIDKPNALCYNSQAAYEKVGGRVIENWTTRDKYKAKKASANLVERSFEENYSKQK